jgi:hemerythrin
MQAQPEFRFTSDLRTGIQAIDRQHVEWFQALETLRKAVAAGRGERTVAQALAFAISYTQRHFGDEEAAMAAAGYAGLEAHRAEHAKLAARLSELTAQLGSDFDCAQEVLTLMGGWIREHIAASDKAYVPALARGA